MKLGASRGKIIMLGGLVVLGVYLFYSNVLSDSGDTPSTPQTPKQGALSAHTNAITSVFNSEPAGPKGTVVRGKAATKASEEFHPTMSRKPEDAVDPMQIDPTLRLDLLAKVQAATLESGGRNPFQFGAPPPPPVDRTKIDVKPIRNALNQPPPPKPAPPGPPPKPVLNLPWKYYGYASPRGSGAKKAFLLDGEDILTAAEGDVLKKKYRIVRIGVNSVVVEDTVEKTQQTIPLQEEANG